MKKIILTLVAASFSLATFAQRSCDVKVTMISPAASATINGGSNITPTFTLTNLGPDSLYVGDSLLTQLYIDASPLTNLFGTILAKAIAKDSSLTLSYGTLKFNFPPSSNGVHNFCAGYQLFMTPSKVADPVTTNNAGCNSVTLANGVGIGAINSMLASSINSYPNPAKDKVNFDIVVEKAGEFSFEIYDVTGKLVKSVSHNLANGNQTVTLDLGEIPAGVYSCKVSSEEHSFVSKLIIQ